MVKLMRAAVLATVLAMLSSGCVYLQRVSTTSTGAEIPDGGTGLDVSADGRYVLFRTSYSMSSFDSNGVDDLYRKDTLTGAVELVTRTPTGGANAASVEGEMSDDGRWVAFSSAASNLVLADTNGTLDVFVHDVVAHTTARASVTSTGGQGSQLADRPAISGDGLHVSFSTASALVPADTDVSRDVYRFERATGAVALVSSASNGVVGDGSSFRSSIDYDGSVIAFDSDSTNLVPGDTNGERDVFVKFDTGLTARVSTGAGNTQATGGSSSPSMSGNGLAVAFTSAAFDLTPGDLNGQDDVFVKAITGEIFLASVATDGTQGSRESNGARISHDGTLVSFFSRATELTQRPTGNGAVVVRDGIDNITTVASRDSNGNPHNGAGVIAAGGTYVLWWNSSPTILPGDTNSAPDTYLQWWSPHEITSISPSTISLGASQPVTITGSGFNRNADISIYTHLGNVDGITFSNVVVVDQTTITADVESTVGVTPVGPKNLWVEAAGGGPGQTSGALANCDTCLTVSL
ncbi:MAG: IPT/TIG domain-containing protein [Acidimicrobiales bacterium]